MVFGCVSFQKNVLSLDGPVVTASGFKDELAVVTGVPHCVPSNDQVFLLFPLLKCLWAQCSTRFSST